ncbi:MAG: sulfatase-like hydrolase/transferase [Candidatus Sumerlaeia bacterium]
MMHNFVIINPDEWRGDYAGCYGHPLVKTPHLDRLAAEGTRFENAFVQHTVCTPSRCSFMTGWYPHVTGHRSLWHSLRPHEPNLLKYLKQAGYEVAWFGKNDLLAAESFNDSVDYYDDFPGFLPNDIENAFEYGEPGYFSFLYKPTPRTIHEHVDALKVKAGIDFLNRPHEKPFCLYLPLSTPHCPYTAPQPYHDMYDPEDVPPLVQPEECSDKPRYYKRIRETRDMDETPEWVFKKLNAVYLGTITMIDEMIGWLLDALDQNGLTENTTVLFFTDHGDYAGDYRMVEKWTAGLEDCLIRTPFVIRTPGGKAGHVVKEPVEVFDQMATILDLAGIEAQHNHFARSLAPQLHGEAGDPNRAAFAEGGYALYEPHCFEAPPVELDPDWEGDPKNSYYPKINLNRTDPDAVGRCSMIRTLGHKLIRRPGTGEHELYDLEKDPQERRNVYADPDYADVRADLEKRLLDWYIETSDVTPFDRDNRGMPPNSVYWRRLTIK